jgi:hypothetical protein
VQIGDENLHLVRGILDELFEARNSVSVITFKKTAGQTAQLLPGTCDYVLWYARDVDKVKFRTLLKERQLGDAGADAYTAVELGGGMTFWETDFGSFINDPDEAKVMMRIDPEDGALVTLYPACQATARHSLGELERRFSFKHEPWCRPEWRRKPLPVQ